MVKAFAGDTVFIESDIERRREITQIFQKYVETSGAKVITEKTTIMEMGTGSSRVTPSTIKLETEMKIKGFKFENMPQHIPKTTWKETIRKITQPIEGQGYQDRNTTIYERTIIINTMVLSQLIFLTTIFEPPKKVIKEINQIIIKFSDKHTLPRPSIGRDETLAKP